MKKNVVSTLLLSVLMMSPLVAQATTCDCNCQDRGYISISATANKEVSPDTVEVSFAVTTFDNKSMQKASIQNKEISDKIYTELKNMINSANGDFIKTANYNATALYTNTNGKKNFDKYQVSNNIILKTKSIDKIGAIIDKATSLGATEVNNLNFTLSNVDEECDELIAQASKLAYNRANVVAKSSMTTVSGIKNLSINYNNAISQRVVYSNLMLKSASSGSSTDSAMVESTSSPIEPGTLKLKVTVSANYFVK